MPGRLFLLLILVLAATTSAAPQTSPPQAASVKSPAASPVVPAGAIIPLELKNTIHSHTAYVGESIYCESIFPVTEDDHVLIPAHSFVRGRVTEIIRPGLVMGKAQLGLRFDSVTLPDGTTRPIKATVYSLAGARLTASKAGEESAEQPESASKATGDAGNAVIDASGLGVGGSVSAISQGVGGLVVMLVTRGKDILLRPGTTLEIQLSEPLDLGPLPPGQPYDQTGPPKLQRRPGTTPTEGSGPQGGSNPKTPAASPAASPDNPSATPKP